MTRSPNSVTFIHQPMFRATTLSIVLLALSAQPSIAQMSAPIVPALAPLSSLPSSSEKAKTGSGTVQPSNTEPLISIKNDEEEEIEQKSPKTSRLNNKELSRTEDSLTDDTADFALPQKNEHNEFQDFITQSIGQNLPIFGRNLFLNQRASTSFAPPQDVAVPGDYVLGIGDELQIRATGSIDINYRVIVDRNGSISVPKIGSFAVAGVRHSEIQPLIQQQIGRLYKDFQVYVSLGKLRSMRVYLVGHVKRPGAYTVSSLSTLVNTLFVAGGPSSVGSLRNIQVKRAGRLITSFDLYDLLLKGDKSKDIRLMPEDVVYISPASKLIALTGSVNQPAIYEMRDHETLGDALTFAGGITAIASTDSITVERIVDRKQRTVHQFSLDSSTLKQPVHEGDLITLHRISRKFDRVVTLRGQVPTPVRLPWQENMHIKDVIPSKEALITPDYYLRIEALATPTPPPSIKDIGKSEETQTSQQNNSIKRLIKEPNLEYAVIERLRDDLSPEIIPFNLSKALEGNKQHNLPLLAGDVITIFSKDDVSVPRTQRSGIVRLEGEFNASGIYRLQPNETLRQLIERAGGITADAHLYALAVERESTRTRQIARYNEWLNRTERDLLRNDTGRTALSAEDAAIQRQESESRRQLLSRMRTVQPSGRIILNFKGNFNPTIDALPDLLLEDGDKIYLPAKSSIVSVIGAVLNDGNFLYRPNKNIEDYLDDSGGPTNFADESNLYIIRTDGSVTSSNQKSLFSWLGGKSLSVQPGDTIVIPEKMGGQSFLSALKDFSTIFYQLGLGAAAIQVLRR